MTADYWRVCQALNLPLNPHFYRTCCDGDHTPKITLGLAPKRRPYSAAAAGGAKMTPAQIAEAQRMAREWKPTK
jgi:hypothetical protein